MNPSVSLNISVRYLCPPRSASFSRAFHTTPYATTLNTKNFGPSWRHQTAARHPANKKPPQSNPSRSLRTLKGFQVPIPRKTPRISVPQTSETISSTGETSPGAKGQSNTEAPAYPAGHSANLSSAPQSPHRPPPNLPYHIYRTRTHNLPVYHLAKAGGNRKLTAVQKVKGNPQLLLQELLAVLEPRPKEAWVNSVNGHVIFKGWYKEQVAKFLTVKGF